MSAIQELVPYIESYPSKIKEAKNAQGHTIQTLVDESGVPYSAVSKLLNGSQQNPLLYNAAALCAVLDLSLDELMGLRERVEPDNEQQHIHELELENARLDGEVKQLKALNNIKDEGLANRRMLIFSLSAITALLLAAVIGYIAFDIGIKNAGLFQSTGVAVTAVLLVIIILAAICLLVYALKTVYNENRPRK